VLFDAVVERYCHSRRTLPKEKGGCNLCLKVEVLEPANIQKENMNNKILLVIIGILSALIVVLLLRYAHGI
jgi:hypothetical protein